MKQANELATSTSLLLSVLPFDIAKLSVELLLSEHRTISRPIVSAFRQITDSLHSKLSAHMKRRVLFTSLRRKFHAE
jgi:hypothetical protein